jgi:site-specific recombinase XerD
MKFIFLSSPACIRRGSATGANIVEQGQSPDIYTIARLLGHEDIRMSTRYTHITAVRKTDGVDAMERRYQEFITVLSQGTKEEGAAC